MRFFRFKRLSIRRPDAYWAFYNAQATLLRGPEFCKVLNRIEYDLAVHQVIEMGKALTATQVPPAPAPKEKGELAERAPQLKMEIHILTPAWKRFEVAIDPRLDEVEAGVRDRYGKWAGLAEFQMRIGELQRFPSMIQRATKERTRALKAQQMEMKAKLQAETERRGEVRAKLEQVRERLSATKARVWPMQE
jgi:hypothetical protein